MGYNWDAHRRGYNHGYAGPYDPDSKPRPPREEGRDEYMAGWKDGMDASKRRRDDKRPEPSEPKVISV